MPRRPHVGAIFVAYQAEHTLQAFHAAFPHHLVRSTILVDDASTDNTFALAQSLGITSYRNAVNLGFGGNIKRALSLALDAGMDVIIDLHPDGEYEASAIPAALAQIEAGADLVLGNRFTTLTTPVRAGMYWWKLPALVLLNTMARVALGLRIHDAHQGFRVYTRKLLERIDFRNNSDGYIFSFELISQTVYHKLKIEEVPVETRYQGKKRGASLRHSAVYFAKVFGVIVKYYGARAGLRQPLYRRPAPGPSAR